MLPGFRLRNKSNHPQISHRIRCRDYIFLKWMIPSSHIFSSRGRCTLLVMLIFIHLKLACAQQGVPDMCGMPLALTWHSYTYIRKTLYMYACMYSVYKYKYIVYIYMYLHMYVHVCVPIYICIHRYECINIMNECFLYIVHCEYFRIHL